MNGSAHLQASGGVRTGPGALVALLLTAGGDAAAVTVYDNTAGAGTVLAVLTAAAGTTAPAWAPPGGQACAHGLYAEITGTAPDVIVVYR
ncbi:MAG: hypothetical protein M5U01_10335 [Ardenticatenaceae bacterium]|nr:hypothetical protein [Ardenticatenaceae bacterium]